MTQRGGRKGHHRRRAFLAGWTALALSPSFAAAQVLQGTVVEEGGGPSLATALVRLLDAERRPVSVSVADSAGRYRVEAPSPGSYYVSVERIGYEPFVSHLLEVRDPQGVYPVDLEMRPSPMPIPGLTVRADRVRAVERRLRLLVGVAPASMRFQPLMRSDLEPHLAAGRPLSDVVRWSQVPSITVKRTTEGPCFQYRARHCVDVYLDDVRVNPELVDILPLDLVEVVVIVMPKETVQYPGGGILLYTRGWIG